MTKEEFQQWKEYKVTKEVMEQLSDVRNQYREAVIQSAASGDNVSSARLAGNIESLDFLLNIQWEGTDD
jgi:hypothetical protein